jgi:hypothetical protein|tara:strand:- start:157 stop:960 length:804 start_codon:yes stop_codon:yes gene_type:complete
MANGIDYRIGPSNKTIEAMLKSDIPEIQQQAQEIIRSQGLEDINMGQNQFLQSGITRSPKAMDFRANEIESLRRDLETTGRDPMFLEKVALGLDKLYQPVEFGPVSIKPLNVLGALSPVPFVPQLTALSGIMGAFGALPDNFKNLNPAAQRFILSQAGGNVPGKDRYGYNIRSALGNYADLVDRRANIARSRQRRGLNLRSMDQYYLDKELERREQQRAEQAAQAARDRARSEAAYRDETGEGSGYSGGFDPSTGNYDDPFDPGTTE